MYGSEENLLNEVARLNMMCNDKGINIRILQHQKNRALIFVFREKLLKSILDNEAVWELLYGCGYQRDEDLNSTLNVLKDRIETSDIFPHEIGIFLGYPYYDVKGFIDNAGNNYVFCGYWKVYENEKQSAKLFQAFDICSECYRKCYGKGIPISRLLVAV